MIESQDHRQKVMKTCRIAVFLAALTALSVTAFAGPRTLLVCIDQSPVAWSDPQLYTKLATLFTRDAALQVRPMAAPSISPGTGQTSGISTDSLIRWGQKEGGAFLLLVTIKSERIERHKSFQVPLIFHKWETVGIIEGEYRFVDIQRGKLMAAEPFSIEMNGPRVFQATMDDHIDDPDIHLRAPDKLVFFSRLEDRLAEQIAKRTRPLIRIRDRESYTQQIPKG
jgi:hypothetical protein